MAVNPTYGAITRICSDNFSDYKEFKPVLQIIDCGLRILLLSDGSHYNLAYLAWNLEDLFTSRKLQKGSIIKLTKFFVDQVQSCMVIIITDLDVILNKCDFIAGEPVALPKKAPSPPTVADLFSNWRKERISVKLTQGAISIMCHDKFSSDDEFMPVLQVMDVDQLPYRYISLSDGWNYNIGIFLRNLDQLDYCSRLQKGSVVKLTHFTVSEFPKNTKYKNIIIIDLEVIADKCELIGDPVSLHNNLPFFWSC